MKMTEACFKCGKTVDEVKLFDGISNNEIVKICEQCSLDENTPIIKKPTLAQLKESERPYTVYQRLRRISGFKSEEKKDIKEVTEKKLNSKEVPSIDDLKRAKTQKEMIEEEYELSKKKIKPLNLVDNYSWHILIARKKKKLTRRQVADLLNESETAMKMIENKELPDDSLKLIIKLEQFFGIKLREEDEEEKPEEIIIKKLEEKPEKIEEEKEVEEPAVVLKFDRETVQNLTIADLKRMKQEKEVIKLEEEKEKLVEEKKVEEKDEMEEETEEKEKPEKPVSDLIEEVKKEEIEDWKKESERSFVDKDIELEE